MKQLQWSIQVRGKVQGVWFRKATMEEALRLGLTGWVANRADGSVAIAVKGPKDVLSLFAAWCKVGPPLAKVQEVIITSAQEEEFDTFEIRRLA